VALCFAYGIIYSLLGFDLVMSLTPGWHSALLGWYFALGGLYSGIAALIVTAVLLRRWLGVSDLVGRNQFRDLGNLLMAFAMAMTYFFYSQALPIWYENLPPETVFAIPRIHLQPWQTLSWVMVGTGYLGVFVLLLVREMKERAATLAGVALLAVAAMWLERYLLVTPSLAPRAVGFPVLELLIGAGFLGVLVLVLLIFLGRHPAPSPLDLALIEDREAWR
jgi:molybdopterin-containing oxidoreductase family membrane subunit